jgi:hypothetical protein
MKRSAFLPLSVRLYKRAAMYLNSEEAKQQIGPHVGIFQRFLNTEFGPIKPKQEEVKNPWDSY